LRGSGVAKRGASCGVSNMIPYRKFSDIQCGEFRTSQPPNPPKAPKVGDEEANDARTLDGLGALVGAPTADPQNQLERDAVVANDLTGENPRTGECGGKAAKPPKDGQHQPIAGRVVPRWARLSGTCSADWGAEDWRARFDERAGFLEHDGRLLRVEAEVQAIERCTIEWLNQHPAPSAPGRCAWCGRPESHGVVVVPFGTEPGTHAWLHAECWPAWHQSRRAEAEMALRRMGIAPGGSLGDHDD
jgi:hypothetical protein